MMSSRIALALFVFLYLLSATGRASDVDSLRMLLTENPDNPTIINDLARALIPDSLERVRQLSEQSRAIASADDNFEEFARSLYLTGDSYWYAQDFMPAISWYEKAASAWEKAGNLLDASMAYNDMAYTYNQINRYDEALRNYRKAMDLLIEIDDEDNLPAVLINIGQVYQAIGMPDSGIYYNSYAAGLSDVPGREEELSAALNNLGFIYKNQGNFDKALEYYNRSYEISRKMAQESWMAIDLNNIGNVYIHWEKYDLAKAHQLQAIDIYKKIADRASLEVSLNNLAYIYQQTGQYDSAMILFKESAAIARELGRTGNEAVRKINIGMLYYHMGEYDQAITYVKEGLETNRELGFKISVAGALQNLGMIYLAKGDLLNSKNSLDEALKLASELNAGIILEKIYEGRSKLFERLGRHREALEQYRLYTSVKDSLFTERSQEKLAEMQARYETKKKQQQIELLVKDNQLQKTELRKKQITLVSLSGGIFILALSAMIIGLMYAQKSRANRKLVEKNLELMKKEDEVKESPGGRPGLPDDEKARIVSGLEILMKKEKAFTYKQLTLSELSARLNTNTAYLSRLINEHYHMNFSNFLNGYRVREAQKMFAGNQHRAMTLEGIAESVGFQSRSTFNAAFKKITGVTPSVFIKNLDQIAENSEILK